MIAIAPSHFSQLANYTSWLIKRNFSYKVLREDDSLDGCSLLILCGGPDVGSAGKRDLLDINWFKAAYGKIPVLGICRGMQLANVALGGTLYEDLPSDLIKHSANKSQVSKEPSSSLISSFHEILLENGQSFIVNSRHHQGILSLAPDLIPIAKCKDGLLEMVKGNKSLFVQWHPEREDVWGTKAEQIVYEWLVENYPIQTPVEKISSYMRTKGFSVVSNERIQKSIDSTYNDEFINKLIVENSTIMRRVRDKKGRTALKMML